MMECFGDVLADEVSCACYGVAVYPVEHGNIAVEVLNFPSTFVRVYGQKMDYFATIRPHSGCGPAREATDITNRYRDEWNDNFKDLLR